MPGWWRRVSKVIQDSTKKVLNPIVSATIEQDGGIYKLSYEGKTKYGMFPDLMLEILNYLKDNGGGKIQLGKGTFYIDKEIYLVNANNIVIEGMGKGLTILKPTVENPTYRLLWFDDIDGLKLANFTLDANTYSYNSSWDFAKLIIYSGKNIEISNIEIKNYWSYALALGIHHDEDSGVIWGEIEPFGSIENVWIHDNYIHDSVQVCGGDGIHLYHAKNVLIENNLVYGTGDDSIAIGGTKDYPSQNNIINGNLVGSTACGRGIKIHTVLNYSGESAIRNVIISNNTEVIGDGGIVVSWESNDSPQQRITHVIISNNYAQNGYLTLTGCNDVTVIGNKFKGYNIYVDGRNLANVNPQPVVYVRIIGNTGGKLYIETDHSVSSGSAQHNSIYIIGNLFAADRGIWIHGNRRSVKDIFITNNFLSGVYGIYVDGYWGIEHAKIIGNIFINQYATADMHFEGNAFGDVIVDKNILLTTVEDLTDGKIIYGPNNYGKPLSSSGIETITGDGSTTVFTIKVPHGLISDKLVVSVSSTKANSSPPSYLYAYLEDTDGDGFKENIVITVKFDNAPTDGEVIEIYWKAEIVH